MQNPSPDLNSEFHEKEKNRFKTKIGDFLVLIENESVLCLRRANTGIEDGLYVFPMGGVQEGETPQEAIIRESFEEAGAILQTEDLSFKHLMYRKHTQPDGYFFYQQDLFFVAHNYAGEIENKEPHKGYRVEFLPLSKLPENFSPCVRRALTCILEGILYSEFGHT